MRKRHFIQCDVFSATPVLGNALAVVVDAEGLTDEQMARFAAWTNLAETTFLLPPTDPTADYRVRIFKPSQEMLFAGHPTLGSCASWLHAGGKPREAGVVRQQCAIGIVDIDMRGAKPAFVAPPTTVRAMQAETRKRIMDTLDLSEDQVVATAELENGPVWQAFELTSAADVLALDSTRVRWPDFHAIGLIGAHPKGEECDYEVRMLAPSSGMSEDPITGSLNAALAHWMFDTDRVTNDVLIAQGTQIQRTGRVTWQRHSGNILIGGDSHILIDGTVTL